MAKTDHTETLFSRLATIRAHIEAVGAEIVELRGFLQTQEEKADLGAQIGEAARMLDQVDDLLTPTPSDHHDLPLPDNERPKSLVALIDAAMHKQRQKLWQVQGIVRMASECAHKAEDGDNSPLLVALWCGLEGADEMLNNIAGKLESSEVLIDEVAHA